MVFTKYFDYFLFCFAQYVLKTCASIFLYLYNYFAVLSRAELRISLELIYDTFLTIILFDNIAFAFFYKINKCSL